MIELNFPSLPLSLAFFLFFLILIKIIPKSKSPNHRQPPGPWKLPAIGSLHHLVGGPPYRVLRDLARKHGPIMHLKLGQVDLVVLSSKSAAEAATKTHDVSLASRPEIMAARIMSYGSCSISMSPYGAYWRQMRKICIVELLSSNRVKFFRALREEEASNLVSSISTKAGTPVNLTRLLLSSASTMVSRAAFGRECKQRERFVSTLMKAIPLASGFNVFDLFPSLMFLNVVSGVEANFKQLGRAIDEISNEIIEEHQMKTAERKAGDENYEQEDLVNVLLRIKEHGELDIPLTMDNIKAVLMDMFGAGTETSSSTVEWAMSELMRNPKVMKKLQTEIRGALRGKQKLEESDINELHFLKLVIKETLRLHPPLPLLLPRLCDKTCEIEGFTIKAGSRVLINVWALARDPSIWNEAESFKPERFNEGNVDFKGSSFEFLPFGAGRRMCPGITFGLANVEFTLAQLVFSFNWELPDGLEAEDLDMDESVGITVRRKNDLCLLATPYIPSIIY